MFRRRRPDRTTTPTRILQVAAPPFNPVPPVVPGRQPLISEDHWRLFESVVFEQWADQYRA